jgi:hypothetical protein
MRGDEAVALTRARSRANTLGPGKDFPVTRESPTHQRRLFPWGLIGLLVFAVPIDAFWVRRDRFETDHSGNWRYKNAAAHRAAATAKLLVFGDSMVEFGVLPRVLESRLQTPVYNLALHGGSPSASYYLLCRALESGGQPSTIIVDFQPHQLQKSPVDADFRRAWPELASPRECFEVARTTSDLAFFGSMLLSKGLATYKARFELRACIAFALEGQAYSEKEILRVLRRNWDRNLGAQIMAEGTRGPNVAHLPNSGLFPTQWSADPASLGYVRRFLTLTSSRKITVLWLMPPLSLETQARRDQLELDEPYDRVAQAIAQAYRNVIIVDARHSQYPPHAFVDSSHLNEQGAVALTAELSDLLATQVRKNPGIRRVDLPRYRERVIDCSVENLDQSKLALMSPAKLQSR